MGTDELEKFTVDENESDGDDLLIGSVVASGMASITVLLIGEYATKVGETGTARTT